MSEFSGADPDPRAWIYPDWPAPGKVRACTTTRFGGRSRPPYEGFNLALHVGDDPEAVTANRHFLQEKLHLPGPPRWLTQVHGTEAVNVAATNDKAPKADACFTVNPGVVCAVLTADCLPVLLCHKDGDRAAAVHAGWRGLAAGAIEAAIEAGGFRPADTLAWLGPAIGPENFEVGDEVRDAFLSQDQAAADAFLPSPQGRWLADLYRLARLRLAAVGIHAVFGGQFCTYTDPRFYSYRKEGATGRMATLIWISV